jgi:hypothetical protein
MTVVFYQDKDHAICHAALSLEDKSTVSLILLPSNHEVPLTADKLQLVASIVKRKMDNALAPKHALLSMVYKQLFPKENKTHANVPQFCLEARNGANGQETTGISFKHKEKTARINSQNEMMRKGNVANTVTRLVHKFNSTDVLLSKEKD